MTSPAAQFYDYSELIGSQLELGYSDQNEKFAGFFPRRGTVTRQVDLEDWGSDWLILQLDEPFDYQLGSLETGLRGILVTHLIVRSRLASYPIGEKQTSVFVLLDPDNIVHTKDHFRSTDFVQAFWGVIPSS